MNTRPGGILATRPLHFIWLCDCSGSMASHGKMQALNEAVRAALPAMRAVAEENPNAQVLIRVLAFSHGAHWHVPQSIRLEDFTWHDLAADPPDTSEAYADIVFLLDTSGSMGPVIEAVKRGCTSFADNVSQQGASVRLGLIGFDIGGHRGKLSLAYSVHNLARYTIGTWSLSSPRTFKQQIEALTVGLFGGGGSYLADPDTVEIFPHIVRVFDGPFLSLRIMDNLRAWLLGHPRHTRHLVIISDEVGTSEGLPAIIGHLREAAITAHVVGIPGADSPHEQLAHQTGGQFWDIGQAHSAQDFDQLLASVAGTIGKEVRKRLTSGAISGGTDMGAALQMLSEQMKMPPMPERAMPPVLALISDGKPSDDFAAGLESLMSEPWGKKAVRVAVAIGQDADHNVLQQFIGPGNGAPLQANNPAALVQHIKWVSTAVLKAASAPASTSSAAAAPLANIPIPAAPAADSTSVADVW